MGWEVGEGVETEGQGEDRRGQERLAGKHRERWKGGDGERGQRKKGRRVRGRKRAKQPLL